MVNACTRTHIKRIAVLKLHSTLLIVLLHRFDDAPARLCDGAFEVRPCIGLLQAGEMQLIMLKFQPRHPGLHKCRLVAVLNDDGSSTSNGARSDSSVIGLTLHGIGAGPSMTVLQHQGGISDTAAQVGPNKVCGCGRIDT